MMANLTVEKLPKLIKFLDYFFSLPGGWTAIKVIVLVGKLNTGPDATGNTSEATFKCGQKSQIVRCRTCLKRLIVRQSAAKIVKLCGEIATNIH